MKRSPIKRKTPLANTGGMKRTPMTTSSKPIKSVNPERKAERHERNFGDEAKAVRAMLCLVTKTTPCEPAHIVSRGASGGRYDIVPLSAAMHAEQHLIGIKSFAAKYSLDLRAEADRVSLLHDPPLGVRGLAQRWLWWEMANDCSRSLMVGSAKDWWLSYENPPPPLDDYELGALLGWVHRSMATHKDWTAEDLAQDVAEDLDITIEQARVLCELAGWPS